MLRPMNLVFQFLFQDFNLIGFTDMILGLMVFFYGWAKVQLAPTLTNILLVLCILVGGIENGENPVDAMIRETREESGLVVLPDTVKEYGYVHRIQRSDGDETECFIQNNYYYLCKTADEVVSQELDD